MRKMSSGKIALISVGIIAVLLVIGCIGNYNSLVNLRETVSSQSSNIDVQLQRRAELIPNLVETVKGYASHETDIINQISESRSNLAGAETISEKSKANEQFTGAISRLLMVVENYPDLKASTQFSALMDELSGTESRISTARRDYNNSTNEYNKKIKTFPSIIFANIFNFHEIDYFGASEGSKEVPSVNFK